MQYLIRYDTSKVSILYNIIKYLFSIIKNFFIICLKKIEYIWKYNDELFQKFLCQQKAY